MKTVIGISCKYPWGIQTQVSVTDDNGDVYNFNLSEAKDEDLIATAESMVTQISESKQGEPVEAVWTITKDQVEEYLKSEGIISETETIEDLKTLLASISEN